jgi:DNA polymerase-1
MESTYAIIDADSLIWETAYAAASSYENASSFRRNFDSRFFGILNYVGATHYVGIIGNHNVTNRKALVPSYKGNRPPKPEFMEDFEPAIEDYLLTQWDFIKAHDGYEADDTVASYARLCRDSKVKHVVCSIDKDLKQIQGSHYNYKNETLNQIPPDEAYRLLFKQTLMGDRTDNIPGIPGIGPVKADKILTNTELGWERASIEAYQLYYLNNSKGLAEFAKNYLLVWLDHTLEVDMNDFKLIQYPAV